MGLCVVVVPSGPERMSGMSWSPFRVKRGSSAYQPNGVAFVNGGTELRVVSGEGFDRGYVLDRWISWRSHEAR